MEKDKKSKVSMLKCSNCGSSIFEQLQDDSYKCSYCGSIAKDNDDEKQSFMKFLNSKSTKSGRIHILNRLADKKDFYRQAVEHIALSKHSPEDILTAQFSDVEIRYSYFLVLNAEFKVATLSNAYFDDISYATAKNKSITINSQMQTEEDVVSESINVCSPLHTNPYEGESQKFYEDITAEFEAPSSITITADQLKEDNIKLPNKSVISAAIDRIISETKTELIESRNEKNIRIMHKINQIDLYIVPEYVLKYKYNNKNYEVESFAYDISVVGTMPNDSENLRALVLKKTAKYPIVSISVSLLGIIFAIIHMTTNRLYDLVVVDFVLIPVMLLVFLSTFFIDKLLTKSILTKRYNRKKQKLKEFFQENKVMNLSQKEDFEGRC